MVEQEYCFLLSTHCIIKVHYMRHCCAVWSKQLVSTAKSSIFFYQFYCVEIRGIITYILVLKGFEKKQTMLTDYVSTSKDIDIVKTESENRNLLTCTLNRNF